MKMVRKNFKKSNQPFVCGYFDRIDPGCDVSKRLGRNDLE